MDKKYGIWCSVWGGVTGRREAWLKKDDKIWAGSQEEAEKMAAELRNVPHSYSIANFDYRPSILPDWEVV